jgi:hypothetical protein
MEDNPLKQRRKSVNKTLLTTDEQYIASSFVDFDFEKRDANEARRTELQEASQVIEEEKAARPAGFASSRQTSFFPPPDEPSDSPSTDEKG